HWGDWYEEMEGRRSAERLMGEISEDELRRRDGLERNAIERASKLPDIAGLDEFRKRAAVRHYSNNASPLLDMSTSPEVAAFFATGAGSRTPTPGSIGM